MVIDIVYKYVTWSREWVACREYWFWVTCLKGVTNSYVLHCFLTFIELFISLQPNVLLKWGFRLKCDTVKGDEWHISNFQFWFFNINYTCPFKCYILIQTHLNRTSDFRDMNNSLKFLNNVKHLSPYLAYNSESIFPTSNSFSLIMSQMWHF